MLAFCINSTPSALTVLPGETPSGLMLGMNHSETSSGTAFFLTNLQSDNCIGNYAGIVRVGTAYRNSLVINNITSAGSIDTGSYLDRIAFLCRIEGLLDRRILTRNMQRLRLFELDRNGSV